MGEPHFLPKIFRQIYGRFMADLWQVMTVYMGITHFISIFSIFKNPNLSTVFVRGQLISYGYIISYGSIRNKATLSSDSLQK